MKDKGRLLGVDFGLQQIGLALSDKFQIIASPLKVLRCGKDIKAAVKTLCEELAFIEKELGKVEKIIVGMPTKLDNSSSFITDEVCLFLDLLKKSTEIEVESIDERLSTVQAEKSLREASLTRKKRKKLIDKVSASVILQSYLDRQAFVDAARG